MRVPATRDAVDTASVVIFDTFYKRNDFSLAAAQSILLFVIILILTLFNQRVLGGRTR
jgi:ABC-type sugar transport system permease subunit